MKKGSSDHPDLAYDAGALALYDKVKRSGMWSFQYGMEQLVDTLGMLC